MLKNKKFISALITVILCLSISFVTLLPVMAESESVTQDTTTAETENVTEVETTTEAVTTEATEEEKPVSDISNIIGIIVAVLVGVGGIAAIIILAPKNNAPKKK